MMFTVEGLHAQYGKTRVLHDVSLGVEEGESVALIGANGAGKSTFLKTISGLVCATQGTVVFMGRRIENLAPEKIVQAGISQVPEGRKVFSKATVMTNLEMGAFNRTDKAEIKKDIEVPEYVPGSGGSTRSVGRNPQWRRAADAGHCKGFDGQTQVLAAR